MNGTDNLFAINIKNCKSIPVPVLVPVPGSDTGTSTYVNIRYRYVVTNITNTYYNYDFLLNTVTDPGQYSYYRYGLVPVRIYTEYDNKRWFELQSTGTVTIRIIVMYLLKNCCLLTASRGNLYQRRYPPYPDVITSSLDFDINKFH